MSDIMKFDSAARKQERADRWIVVGKGGSCYIPVKLFTKHRNGGVSFGFCRVSESRNDVFYSITLLCSRLMTSTGQ